MERVKHFLQIVDEFIYSQRFPLVLCLIGGSLLLIGLNPRKFQLDNFLSPTQEVKVDVSGAVINPGVYVLPQGSRVEDAIIAAGGLRENVDQSYLSKNINLAQKVSDGQKIYLPFEGERIEAPSSALLKISINQASAKQLEELSGIGPSTAEKIIRNRPYSQLHELVTKGVISQSLYNKIKDSLEL